MTDKVVFASWSSTARENHITKRLDVRHICEQTTKHTITAKTISSNQDVITITFNTDSAAVSAYNLNGSSHKNILSTFQTQHTFALPSADFPSGDAMYSLWVSIEIGNKWKASAWILQHKHLHISAPFCTTIECRLFFFPFVYNNHWLYQPPF